jgi:hypothetical protein
MSDGFGLDCKHIYLSSIAKQFLSTNIIYFPIHVLEPTSTGVIWRIMVVTRFGLEPMIQLAWEADTLPLGNHSSLYHLLNVLPHTG